MDRYEYRSQQAERRATGGGIALTGAGVANEWASSSAGIDPLQATSDGLAQGFSAANLQLAADFMANLPGGSGLIAAGIAVAAGGQAHRLWRQSNTSQLWRLMHEPQGWATLPDLWRYSGSAAARRDGKATRHSMSWWERHTAKPSEFGMYLGRTLTGPLRVRGRRVVSSWQRGVLVSGEPGTWKSGLLAHTVVDYPGPAVIVSTKTEFWQAAAELRQAFHGPVRLFSPRTSTTNIDPELVFTWDMVEGCRDAVVAERRAQHLMEAASGSGLQNADFWANKGKGLIKSLLCAADLDEKNLRDVAGWLQAEDYTRPLKVLQYHADQVEPTVISSLKQYASSAAQVTSSSAAHTAAQVVEFLSDPNVAAALAPPRGTGLDMEAFLRQNGTIFVVTDGDTAMGPVINALANHVAWTLKQMVAGGSASYDPPLGFIIDEAHKTMPSVKLHEMAAELRGWGVWMSVAVQNWAQLKEKWGHDAAETLSTVLQTTVVTGAHGHEDRRRHSDRIGPRKTVQVTHSLSEGSSSDGRGGLFSMVTGNNSGTSTSFQTVREDLWPPERFADLKPGWAMVIPSNGRAMITKFEHGLGRAAALLEKLHAKQDALLQRAAEKARREQAAGEAAAEGDPA